MKYRVQLSSVFVVVTLSLICLVVSFIVAAHWFVTSQASTRIYSSINQLPARQVALVLGTSRYRTNGDPNPFFHYRIDAAAELFKAGKVKCLIVSGDNRAKEYNEPREMRRALLAEGVPSNRIVLDYAGFRTFDSVIRCHEVFGQDSFIVVSQKFQNERAVFIALKFNINVIAFNAKDVPFNQGISTYIREYMARVKVLLDVYVINSKPHFLGNPILLELN